MSRRMLLVSLAALAACAPKRIHEEPILENGDRVQSPDAVVAMVQNQAAVDQANRMDRRDQIAAEALESCTPEICRAVTRGELMLGMSEVQVMAATRTTPEAWSIRRSGSATVMVPRSLSHAPRDGMGEVAMVQLRDDRVASYSYREAQGIRLVAEARDAGLEGRATSLADMLIREGDDLVARGDLDAALDRYDRASVLRADPSSTTASPRSWTSNSGPSRRWSAIGSSSTSWSWSGSRRSATPAKLADAIAHARSGSSSGAAQPLTDARPGIRLRRPSPPHPRGPRGACGGGVRRGVLRYDVAPNGLPRSEDRLRQDLAFGRADSALARLTAEKGGGPEDDLLRALYAGILAHYAGAYDSSSAALQRAAELAEDRYTKRVSRAALSFITSDNVLPYEPGWTERLLIHSTAPSITSARRPGGAAVEATAGALLEREAERSATIGPPAPATSLLRAWCSRPPASGTTRTSPIATRSTSSAAATRCRRRRLARHRRRRCRAGLRRPPGRTIDRGVASPGRGGVVDGRRWRGAGRCRRRGRRTDRGGDDGVEVNRPFSTGARPRSTSDSRPTITTSASARRRCERRRAMTSSGTARIARIECPGEGENPYLLRIAWPAFVWTASRDRSAHPRATPLPRWPIGRTYRGCDPRLRRRAHAARRADHRARRLEDGAHEGDREEHRESDDAWIGRLLGAVTNVGTAILEQADTRSWQLLPGQIGRASALAGTHDILVEVPAGGQRRQVPAVGRCGRVRPSSRPNLAVTTVRRTRNCNQARKSGRDEVGRRRLAPIHNAGANMSRITTAVLALGLLAAPPLRAQVADTAAAADSTAFAGSYWAISGLYYANNNNYDLMLVGGQAWP